MLNRVFQTEMKGHQKVTQSYMKKQTPVKVTIEVNMKTNIVVFVFRLLFLCPI